MHSALLSIQASQAMPFNSAIHEKRDSHRLDPLDRDGRIATLKESKIIIAFETDLSAKFFIGVPNVLAPFPHIWHRPPSQNQ